jgi:hypothetical protein
VTRDRAPDQPPSPSRRHSLASGGAALLAGVVSVACTSGSPAAAPAAAEYRLSLPGLWAWFDGRRVAYVSTDVSDAGMAAAMGLNFVPRLAEALDLASAGGFGGPVERVYMFPGGEQINIFASAPEPAGARNLNPAYSPLWQVVRVLWRPSVVRRELKSSTEVLDAAERREVTIEPTAVVVNCPVLRSGDGTVLPGLR